MNKTYSLVAKIDMLSDKRKMINKLNSIAIVSILIINSVVMLLNYVFRMRGEAGGIYFICGLCGAIACVIYIYLHELSHALAVIMIKGVLPEIRFGKLVASCGVPMVAFNKTQYFFVASFPFVSFCLILIPLCIVLPPVYSIIPFMPLCYNVFGSMGDAYMIKRMMVTPKNSVIVDNGTSVAAYTPI